MAYQTGSSTTIENLMTQLSTFLQANGWTEDFVTLGDPGRMGLSKNGIFVAFQWTEATDGGTLAIYQNLSNDDSTEVWNSTGDSGNGQPSATASQFDSSRSLAIIAGPHAAYHFFEQDSGPAYIHIVLEVQTNRFRHFGFGEIEKIGDWQGGEYCYSQNYSTAIGHQDNPRSNQHLIGFDGGAAGVGNGRYATMHIRDQPEQVAADRWGNIGNATGFPAGTDRAGNDRLPLIGSTRGGITAPYMSQF